MLKIIVDSEELKKQILNESEYLHDFILISDAFNENILELYPEKINTLMHIYKNSDIVEVKVDLNE